jgi:hypothetical protein
VAGERGETLDGERPRGEAPGLNVLANRPEALDSSIKASTSILAVGACRGRYAESRLVGLNAAAPFQRCAELGRALVSIADEGRLASRVGVLNALIASSSFNILSKRSSFVANAAISKEGITRQNPHLCGVCVCVKSV